MQPTSSPVKVGVIGIGNMGWHHARVLSLLKDANLIATPMRFASLSKRSTRA